MKNRVVPSRILIIDDELPIREVLSAALRDEGHSVQTASDAETGMKAILDFRPEIVFLDIWMPGSLDGVEVLKLARQQHSGVEFVMISGHGTIETAVKATKLGAWDFIEKPLSMDKILISISNIQQFQQEKSDKEALLSRLRKSIAILGESQSMVRLKQSIAQWSPTSKPILLCGESGSGKELAAKNIHYLSDRAGRPFLDLSCVDLTEDLIEYELFGFEKGSLPGVAKARKGKVDLVADGTIYFHDIADLSLYSQDVLLRLIKEQSFRKFGSAESSRSELRILLGTSRDLEKEVAANRMREEFLGLMSSSILRLPPLREHREDIPALVKHFADQVCRESGMVAKVISDPALQLLVNHGWPGNVGELRNFVERLYILTPGEVVDVMDVRFAGLSGSAMDPVSLEDGTFREARAQFEREYLIRKIKENQGNISKTAEAIGLERSYLHRKIKTFGIEVPKLEEAL